MWKTGLRPAAARIFYPQPIVDNFFLFHRHFLFRRFHQTFHNFLSTIHRACGKKKIMDNDRIGSADAYKI